MKNQIKNGVWVSYEGGLLGLYHSIFVVYQNSSLFNVSLTLLKSLIIIFKNLVKIFLKYYIIISNKWRVSKF